MNRNELLKEISKLSQETREQIAKIVELTDVQVDYLFDGEREFKVDCGRDTLESLAQELRNLSS